jgi:hypothetical protein
MQQPTVSRSHAILTYIAAATLALALGVFPDCSLRPTSKEPADKKQVQPVSEQPPQLVPQAIPDPMLAIQTPVASQGDCAPRYKNGLTGNCINNQPCRGFGVLNDKNNAECSCYGIAGGCQEAKRCDAIRKSCVPEEEMPFERAPAR